MWSTRLQHIQSLSVRVRMRPKYLFIKQPSYNLRPREVPSYVPIQGRDDTNFEIPHEAENSVDSSGIETNDEENNSIEINKENVDETIEELIKQVPEIIIYIEEDEKKEFDDNSDTSTVDIEEGNSSSENLDKECTVNPEPDKVNRIQWDPTRLDEILEKWEIKRILLRNGQEERLNGLRSNIQTKIEEKLPITKLFQKILEKRINHKVKS